MHYSQQMGNLHFSCSEWNFLAPLEWLEAGQRTHIAVNLSLVAKLRPVDDDKVAKFIGGGSVINGAGPV